MEYGMPEREGERPTVLIFAASRGREEAAAVATTRAGGSVKSVPRRASS